MKQRPRIYYTETQKVLMWEPWLVGWSVVASIVSKFSSGGRCMARAL